MALIKYSAPLTAVDEYSRIYAYETTYQGGYNPEEPALAVLTSHALHGNDQDKQLQVVIPAREFADLALAMIRRAIDDLDNDSDRSTTVDAYEELAPVLAEYCEVDLKDPSADAPTDT